MILYFFKNLLRPHVEKHSIYTIHSAQSTFALCNIDMIVCNILFLAHLASAAISVGMADKLVQW